MDYTEMTVEELKALSVAEFMGSMKPVTSWA